MMRQLICNKCREYKDETEFEYIYFQRKYKHICKECDEPIKPNKITSGISGNISGTSGNISS